MANGSGKAAGGNQGAGAGSGGQGGGQGNQGAGHKPEKFSKKFIVTIYVYAGGGYNDPANATPLPPFGVDVRTKPREHFSENDIDKVTQDIALNGFIYKDPTSKVRTTYPPNRISHIEAVRDAKDTD
jgi:hypothetical protein